MQASPSTASRYMYTEVWSSVKSLTNYVALLRCAVGQPWCEVLHCSPTVTYANHAQLKDSPSDLSSAKLQMTLRDTTICCLTATAIKRPAADGGN